MFRNAARSTRNMPGTPPMIRVAGTVAWFPNHQRHSRQFASSSHHNRPPRMVFEGLPPSALKSRNLFCARQYKGYAAGSSVLLARKGAQVTGIDVSRVALQRGAELAKRNAVNVKFLQMAITRSGWTM